MPDPGTPFQLVHHDDVASALVAATLGAGPPGVYNLAGEGTITLGDLARELGWLSIPVPAAAARPGVARRPRCRSCRRIAQWIHAGRVPVMMDTTRARRELGWRPAYSTRATLQALVAA